MAFDRSTRKKAASKAPKKSDMVFLVHLLFKEEVVIPSEEECLSVMEKHIGPSDCKHNGKMAGFHPKKYDHARYDSHPYLMISPCTAMDDFKIDEFTKAQIRDCNNKEEILENAKNHIIAADSFTSDMNYKKRAEMLMEYVEGLVELFPECIGVLFQPSGKMFSRDQIANNSISKEDKFVYFVVNARCFYINEDEAVIDTMGLGILGLPDIQYHFGGIDPAEIAYHAYIIASFIYNNNNPVNENDSVDGIKNGEFDPDTEWKCRYEESLIQPVRTVIDINTGEYARGVR